MHLAGPPRASVGLSSAQTVDCFGLPIALTCVQQPSSFEIIPAEAGSENAIADCHVTLAPTTISILAPSKSNQR